jgi:integrase/recombinase XerD
LNAAFYGCDKVAAVQAADGRSMEEVADILLQKVMAAGEERQLAGNTLTAYRRTWLRLAAWAAAEGVALSTMPRELAAEFYSSATRGRSASHHLQVKAALGHFYRVLAAPNPFAECDAPKFRIEATEVRYHTPMQLGQLLLALRADWQSYFGQLTYHLALALFFTACRFHEWAKLTADRLVCNAEGVATTARMRVQGGTFRDLPLSEELSAGLRDWRAFLESVRGHRLRAGSVDFAASPLVFPGRDGLAISNQAFNGRLKRACLRAGVPVISAHSLRHTAATLLLNERGATLRDVQSLLGHKNLVTTARYTLVDRQRLRGVVEKINLRS